ncbi:MAG: metal-dependent hydrolase [Granulosicoccaceae bacterium]|jgi:inner membrane protein
MDPVTQGFLGAALAQSGARHKETRLATGIGFGAGLIADADVLIRSSQDSLLSIEFHRHFTHSLFFVPFGGLIAALILWPFLRKRIGFARLYLFSLLGYSLSGFIDACTSYGTHLFWPLSNERVAFHLIAIVDPLFTVPLIIAVLIAWRRRLARAAHIGLVYCALYLTFGFVQLERATAVIETVAAERGHQPEMLMVKPTFGNLLLWRTIYRHDDTWQVDAVRVGLAAHTYAGESVGVFEIERNAPQLAKDSTLYRDIERFSFFSQGYIAVHPQRPDVLIDVRYSPVPTSVSPLWGIEMNWSEPAQHARFGVYRKFDAANRQRFYDMVLGEK